MQAYFDTNLKVWVFPGEDPADVAAPLPPPPKMSRTPDKSAIAEEPKQQSNDPLAAMMAPPRRNPTAARSKAFRPSPSSMPVMFPPGMASSIPGAATPKFAVFQPKQNLSDDGKKENDEPAESD